ncbi:MAG: hypothetical protein Q4P34_07755 [Tissierellia bacterium]|nr:hypothetical protein [Tissierellia bacterium]
MKKFRIFRLILISIIILFPLLSLTKGDGLISEIDNKYLTDYPDIKDGLFNFMHIFDNYLKDRLGGRERLLRLDGLIDDKLFKYLDHSLYEYGKEGHVFLKLERYDEDYEFLDSFSDYLLDIQNYCEERDTSFIYLLNPSKNTVYRRYLPDSYKYENKRLDYLRDALYEKGVNFVDNTDFLTKLSYQEQVMNLKYDAGHWNNLGAFYGVNNLLDRMKDYDSEIELNQLDDFEMIYTETENLMMSNIPIKDGIVNLVDKNNSFHFIDDELSEELEIDENYSSFLLCESDVDNDVDLMLFSGSYFNTFGYTLLARAVKNLELIHNYNNIINFDYYYNIFEPSFVVITSAEYATTENYFNIDLMEKKTLNPKLIESDYVKKSKEVKIIGIEEGKYLTKVRVELDDALFGYYKEDGRVYDLIPEGDIWTFTFKNGDISFEGGEFYIDTHDSEKLIIDLK